MANQKYVYVDGLGNLTEDLLSVSAFAGLNSADRLVKTDSTGKIDNSLINFQAFDMVFAARAASSVNVTLSAPGSSVGGVTLSSGDRFLAYGQTDATENGIYVFNGAASPATRALDYNEDVEIKAGDIVVIEEGTYAERVYILTTNNPIVIGTTALNYASLGTQLIDAGNGLSFSGTTLNVNLASGGGLKFVGDDIAVEPNDFAGLGLQDDGNDNLEIDFADPATEMNTSRAVKASDLYNNGVLQGAKIIGFDPSDISAYTTATYVQGAIEDAFAFAQAPGVLYTAGAGGVTKGDLVYVSANNTVLKYSNILNQHEAIGIAASTVAAGQPVKVVETSTVLTGILSGVTLDAKVYWSGSAWVSAIPTTANAYVYMGGRPKNATDLHVRVEFIKRNSP